MTDTEAQEIINNWRDYIKRKEDFAQSFKTYGVLSTPKSNRYKQYCTCFYMLFCDIVESYEKGKITDADTLIKKFVDAEMHARGRYLLECDC